MPARHALFAVAAAVLVSVVHPARPARAAPGLSVKARTELRLSPIRKTYGDRYVISGQLVDRFSGAPISGEVVRLRVAGVERTARTGADGTFEMTVDAPGGKQDVEVRFDGADRLDPAEVTLQDVDVDKMGVDLAIETAAEADGVRVTVGARAAGAVVQLPVAVHVAPADAPPERLREVARITAGGAPLVVTRATAGGPGRYRVRATFAGDDVYNPASADATIELATSTTTTLALRGGEVAYEDDVVATGKVVDDDGAGVAGAAVALLADGRRLAQAVTGKDGGYRFRVEAEALGQGRHGLQAIVEPTAGWMRASRSDVAHVEVAAPQPVPLAYTIAAFAATALVAAGFFAARSRAWEKLVRRPPRASDDERAPDTVAEPTAGLVPARASLVSTLRRPADHGFAGVVRDAIRHRPLAGARVVLRRAGAPDGPELERTTGGDGAFAVEDLPPADWRVEVVRHAHVTERFTLTIPHRGELRGARVDLMPVRERIFSLYKRAALPLLPDPAMWGVWSPRQVLDHVRRSIGAGRAAPPGTAPTTEIAALTDFVEEAYFAAEQPGEDRLPDAQARVEAALREQVRKAV